LQFGRFFRHNNEHMTNSTPNTAKTAPADGERRALRNLSAQYQVAAKLIYTSLLDGELEWIRLVDPDAERLDDIVIGRPGRVDAYQVKWSEYRGQITFHRLVTPTKVSGKPYPAPFTLLAEGWRALSGVYPDRAVHAHFLTHDAPSSNDGKKKAGAGDPEHLQGFLRHAWPTRHSWHSTARANFRDTWQLRIDAIAACAGYSGAELDRFLAHCELDLGFDLQEAQGTGAHQDDKDVVDLAHFLAAQAAASAGVVKFTRAELLRGMGWSGRFEFAFKHDFPVDERLYRPVEETVRAIGEAIEQHDRGYIALIGPPGSGKSTALTHTLRYARGIRLVRYYAFVRDDPRPGRGEATAFLHDLCLSLEPLAPRAARRRARDDNLDSLREEMAALLAELSADWTNSGIKTVILVDGLDHIAREQNPVRSLVEELPRPDAIPDGVLIILGTQRVGLQSNAATLRPITAQLEQHGRTLEMERLSRASVRSIVQTALEPELLAPGAYEQIENLSAGHPLALAYLLKRLATASDATAVGEILHAASTYDGEIEADYRIYWETLSDQPDVRDLLGLIARLRGAIDLSTVEAVASSRILERFVATASHYFHQDTATTWRFFHNSFRQFVLDITARNALNRPDPAASVDFHRRLAEAGAREEASRQLEWERLFHLDHAGRTDLLLKLDHQPLFRSQFLNGRADWEIKDDIDRCMRVAANVGDAMAVLGLMLAQKELGDRISAFELINLATLELRLRPPQDRASALIAGPELLVPDHVAIEWASRLLEEGDPALANRVFDMAEPLDFLSGVRAVDASGHNEALTAWAKVSWRFRPLEVLVAAAMQVRVDVLASDIPPPYEDQKRANFGARRHVLAEMAEALLDAEETALLDQLFALIDDFVEAVDLDLRLDVSRVRRAIRGVGNTQLGADALNRILSAKPPESLNAIEAVRVADLICGLEIDPERADSYLAVASGPIIANQLDAPDDDPFSAVEPLFRQARAQAARVRPFDPATDIPEPERIHGLGSVLFQRAVVRVANVWGYARSGRTMSPGEAVRQLRPVVRLFRRSFGETHRWLDWHYAQRASGQLFEHMLLAAHAHGREAFQAVLEATIEDWSRKDRDLIGWSPETRRAIALAAHRLDGDEERTIGILIGLDSGTDIEFELYDRVEQWRESMEAWLEVGMRERARQSRDAMLATSFGIYIDRDDQIEDWAKIAAGAIGREDKPEVLEDTARTILTILRVLNRCRRGGGRDDAVRTILSTLSGLDPAGALLAADWLLDGNGAARTDVLTGLAIGQLASSDPDIIANALTATSRLILPFELSSTTELGGALADVAGGQWFSHPRVSEGLELARRTIRARVQHRRAFDDFLGVERTPRRERGEDKDPSGMLTCSDGTILTQAQVETLASKPEALAKSLCGATPSKMHWQPVIAALPETIDRSTLHAIGEWIVSAGTTAFALRDLVRRASLLGDRDLSEKATAAAIAGSNRGGWLPGYDGGSRLAAAECLAISDPERGRRRALELLVDDHIERPLAVRDLVASIESILPFISDTTDPRRVWSELRKHVGALAEITENPDHAPSLMNASNIAPGELSSILILRDIDHHANALAWEARKGLLALLMSGDPNDFARNGLRDALGGDLNRRTAALATISCLAWSHPGLVGDLAELVRPMAWDTHGVVRRLAQQILLDLNEELPEAPPERGLPPIYSLHLPETQMPDRSLHGSDIPRGEPLPDTEDSVDLSRLFHDAFRLIEGWSGIPFANLARRFAQIMHRIAPPDTWSAAAERKLTSHLEAIGLKVSVRRPRSLVSHQAFGVLLAEMCDAGVFEWPVDIFDSNLLLTDPYIDTRDPDPKPDWLDVPSGKALGAYPREDWLRDVGDALPTLRKLPDGRIVLAEWTQAVSLDSDREEESRVSIMAHPQMTLGEGTPNLYRLWRDSDYIGREYPMLFRQRGRPVAAVAGGPMFSDADFLALNPQIGFALNWEVADEGLFRWVDSAGKVMTESVWWQDGNLFVNDHSGLDEAAYQGWLVLVSPEGWSQLRPKIANFLVHRSAGRSAPDSKSPDGEMLAVHVDSQPLPF
jgi:hypothetical protein